MLQIDRLELGGSQPSGSLAFRLLGFSGDFHLAHYKLSTFSGGSEDSPVEFGARAKEICLGAGTAHGCADLALGDHGLPHGLEFSAVPCWGDGSPK